MTNKNQYSQKVVVISDISNTKYLVINKISGMSGIMTYNELAQEYGSQLVDDAINGEDTGVIAVCPVETKILQK
jgi:hypothetical protein